MNANQIQEICESIVINALNGGELRGYVFRRSDTAAKGKPDMITVEAATPVPMLEAFAGHRVAVTIEHRTIEAGKAGAVFGTVMERLLSASIMRSAALSAGIKTSDDLILLDEEIAGDRSANKNTRRRSLTIPFLIGLN